MKLPRNRTIFALSLLVSFVLMMAVFTYEHFTKIPELKFHELAADISVTEQIQPEQIRQVYVRGYATIIDLRPDGEAPEQPSSSSVARAAKLQQLEFAYIPVPHGDIVPDAAVSALSYAIATSPKPILLYCRSGRRAVRTWALAEASRPGGMDVASITEVARSSGQSIEDLSGQIQQRFAQRSPGVMPNE